MDSHKGATQFFTPADFVHIADSGSLGALQETNNGWHSYEVSEIVVRTF
jgi:hypothetical protein